MIVAHDLGTTGNKAGLYDDDLALVESTTETYPADFGAGGRAEQDPHAWWDAVARSTRALLEAHPDASIDCVSFSGQMMGVVPVDSSGRSVRPAIIWADTRSGEQCGRLLDSIPMERGYNITGHRLNPTYSLSKLMWLRDTEPDAFARTALSLQAKDYAVYRLTGVMATDPSDASSTNAFDQRAGMWSDDLLAAAALPRELWPEVVPSTTIVGNVTDEAADATGLAQGTPVVLGGGDGPCAATGAGVVSPEAGAYAYLGSSSWISLSADEPLHDADMRTMTFNHVIPGLFVPTATMQAGGASVEWLADVLLPGRSADRFERLTSEAAEVQAADDGLLFLPHILGERSPYWNPKARGVFFGLAKHHGPGHLMRAVMEGVAMNLFTAIVAFREMGRSIDAVDVIGGGGRSDVWIQILADVWGIPVTRRSLVEEANGLGAALTGGVGIGLVDSFDVAPDLSETDVTVQPDEIRHNSYRRRYELFIDAYRRLEPLFDEL